jgi:hypothetical protein
MAEVVSCHPVTTETLVKSQPSPCGICSGQNGTGTVSSKCFSFSPVSIIPSAHHIHSFICHQLYIIFAVDGSL